MLSDLCAEEGVDPGELRYRRPGTPVPLILELRARYEARRKRPRRTGRIRRLAAWLRGRFLAAAAPVERWLAGNRSLTLLIGFLLVALPVTLAAGLVWAVARMVRLVARRTVRNAKALVWRGPVHRPARKGGRR